MIETGICYLRAGDSKGSLCITPGFERLSYVLLHTNGEDCQLFKLKSKGQFNIWTKETLEKYQYANHLYTNKKISIDKACKQAGISKTTFYRVEKGNI